jgi:hypothetical protein
MQAIAAALIGARQALPRVAWLRASTAVPRRLSEPGMVSISRGGEGAYRSMAATFQRSRPHSSLGYLTLNDLCLKEQDRRAVKRRDAAVCGASTPRPVAQPSRRDKCSKPGSRLKLTLIQRIRASQLNQDQGVGS